MLVTTKSQLGDIFILDPFGCLREVSGKSPGNLRVALCRIITGFSYHDRFLNMNISSTGGLQSVIGLSLFVWRERSSKS
jgi:hypothetical protein